MMLDATSSLADVAFAVCTALHRSGTTAVLTGGSAATFYAPEAYQSADIDFVVTFNTTGKSEQALTSLGFERTNDFYQHPVALFPLDFPPGPLMVGADLITQWNTEHRGDQVLHVLSPTDCCRDRLAAFLFWNDFSGLEQALAVSLVHGGSIDTDLIRNWCEREGCLAKYELFAQRLCDDSGR